MSPAGPGRPAAASRQTPSFTSSTAALVGAALFSQVASFATTLLVARLYGPFEVGVFGLFSAAFTLVIFAASWRYEVAIVTVDGDEEAEDIALFIQASGIASAIAITLFLLLIEALPGEAGLSRPMRRALTALPVSLILASAILAGTNICVRQRRFALVAIHQVVLTLATALAQLFLAGVELPGSGLVAGFVIGQGCGLLVFARPLVAALGASVSRTRLLARIRTVAGRHSSHFLYTVPYSLVTQFYYQMPVLLLGALFGSREAGFFSLAFRTTFTPITLVPTALAQVFFPEMARDRGRLEQWESRLLAFLVALGVILAPAAALLIVFGPELYAMVLGETWREAGLFAQIMIAANLLNGLAAGYDRIYFILNRQRTALIVTCIVSCVSLFLMLAAEWATHVPLWLVVGWTLGHLVMAFGWMSTIYRIAGFSLRALVGRWLTVAASVAIIAVALGIAKTFTPTHTWFFPIVAATMAAYCLAAWRVLLLLKEQLSRRRAADGNN